MKQSPFNSINKSRKADWSGNSIFSMIITGAFKIISSMLKQNSAYYTRWHEVIQQRAVKQLTLSQIINTLKQLY